MNVDEARRQCLTVARNRDERLTLRAVADDSDPSIGKRDVGDERRIAAAVIDARVLENRLQQRLA